MPENSGCGSSTGLSATREPLWTRSGVRLRQLTSNPGRWNWLFLPGGPGLGAETLADLARTAGVAGATWLVDLPGDGSNRAPAGAGTDPYGRWPQVLVEAARVLDSTVLVAHSTGGMFALSVPELESCLSGLVLISSAPHAGWRSAFGAYAETHPLTGLEEAADRYGEQPDDETLRDLTLAAAAWNFTPEGLAAGRAVLERAAYNHRAVAWADANFDDVYRSTWSPATIPALIVSGSEDHVVSQDLWREAPGFDRPNIIHRVIEKAGHFPWLEHPGQVRAAFVELVARMETGRDH
ncbi:alpha/beta fold hydrolase [Streptomyces sp. IBSNAI002]|uniref:alpha/beta fold hydrolase n=1 Tax=Streptomyces sp. IBSNAI002 TaxID=3457500 RepID=UPI003FD26B88